MFRVYIKLEDVICLSPCLSGVEVILITEFPINIYIPSDYKNIKSWGERSHQDKYWYCKDRLCAFDVDCHLTPPHVQMTALHLDFLSENAMQLSMYKLLSKCFSQCFMSQNFQTVFSKHGADIITDIYPGPDKSIRSVFPCKWFVLSVCVFTGGAGFHHLTVVHTQSQL